MFRRISSSICLGITFNSLFEMHTDMRVQVELPSDLAAFNSLFEMP